jgi:phage shock protein PspC (stress-responsive transcriptional regulator)
MKLRLKLPKHVTRYFSKGKEYFYLRKVGIARVRLPGVPWTPEFMEAYEQALAGPALPSLPPFSTLLGGIAVKRGVDPNTVQPLIGVYLLMLKGKIVYIGSSLNMPRRIADHRGNGRPFDHVLYIATKANERERLEATLIRAINPSQNRQHRSAIIEANGNPLLNGS